MHNAKHLLPQVAYFSMEIALESAVPTYSGGLGVLAGDTMRSAADLAVPVVGVTLVSQQGYFHQEISGQRQVEHPDEWVPRKFTRALPHKVLLRIGTRDVWVGAWEYFVQSECTNPRPVPVLLLDTDLPENHPDDRQLTRNLYGGDPSYRLRQEMVLGVAGVRMLAAAGFTIHKYHLNEGHAALLTLELLRRLREEAPTLSREERIAAVRHECVFTTHTPVPAGHDQFDYSLAVSLLGELAEETELRAFAGHERLNMTRLALSLTGWVNGVAQRHAEISRVLFPGYEVHAITNGVHPGTWASDAHRTLYDKHIPHWREEPELLMRVERIPRAEIAAAHAHAKRALITYAGHSPENVALDPDRFTIGFARRMTNYKRPQLLFSDVERLKRIARKHPIQIVLAGKAHPRDVEGKRHIEALLGLAHDLAGTIPVVFLPNYNMDVARLVVSGVDVWLNTPQRPLEASGTSGMKAALNGVPNLSVLDGWWLEGWEEGVTGWAVGEDGPDDSAADSRSLYQKLEETVLPLYYEDRAGWCDVMAAAIARNGSYFNSHRMLRRYVLQAYTR